MVRINQMHIGLVITAAALTLIGGLGFGAFRSPRLTLPIRTARVAAIGSAQQRKPLEYYVQGLNPRLFEPIPSGESLPATTPRRKGETRTVRAPLPESNEGLAEYAFTGVATLNGRTVALIENIKSKAGAFVGVGDHFLNCRITGISDRGVTLTQNGIKRTIRHFENYKLTPLSADAPFMRAAASGGTSKPVAQAVGQSAPAATSAVPTPMNNGNPSSGNPMSPPQQPAPAQQPVPANAPAEPVTPGLPPPDSGGSVPQSPVPDN